MNEKAFGLQVTALASQGTVHPDRHVPKCYQELRVLILVGREFSGRKAEDIPEHITHVQGQERNVTKSAESFEFEFSQKWGE